MIKLSHIITTAINLLLVASCMTNVNTNVPLCTDSQGTNYLCPNGPVHEVREDDGALFKPGTNFQTLGEYTEQMAFVLYNKLSVSEVEKLIAVPAFVSLLPENAHNEKLTVDLPEFFIADMQNIGLPVAEYKLTREAGNRQKAFTDVFDELQSSQKFGYVLKGTMRNNNNGIMLYVKIINLEKNTVIASTSKLLPNYLIDKLIY